MLGKGLLKDLSLPSMRDLKCCSGSLDPLPLLSCRLSSRITSRLDRIGKAQRLPFSLHLSVGLPGKG